MPTFTMMIGLPGSGKSTIAHTFFLDDVVYSSDAMRAELFGDERDMDHNDMVFDTLHQRIFDRLSAGQDVVYDATNINYKRRMQFLRRVRALDHNIITYCVFCHASYDVCLARNADRQNPVPESAIHDMYTKFDIPMYAEGWDHINVYDTAYAEMSVDPSMTHHRIDQLLCRLSKIQQDNPHHDYTIGQHCVEAYQQLLLRYDADRITQTLSRATLLHDIGKEKTKVFQDAKGNPSDIAHYYNHERVGAYDSFLYTTDMDDIDRLYVAVLIRWHMWPFVVKRSTNPMQTMKRIERLIGSNMWLDVLKLNRCDVLAH